MSLNRFYCQHIDGDIAQLTESEARHAVVLRLKAGDKIEIVDGKGGLGEATIDKIGKRQVLLKVQNFKKGKQGNYGKLAVAVSISKGSRFDWMVGKCTELGVDRIFPVIYERTVKLAKGDRSLDRWNNIAVSAMKQCGRLWLPQIDEPAELETAAEKLLDDKYNFLICSHKNNQLSLDKQEFQTENICGFIGPEGGMTENEEGLLMKKKAVMCKLNENVLRVETAAVAFCSIAGLSRVR